MLMKTRILPLLLAPLLLLGACLETTSFPPEPVIGFKDFVQYGADSAIVTITFTDGDGNFGLEQSDTIGDFCPVECLNYWNCFLEYYEREDGEWVHQYIDWTDDDTPPFYYRIPRVYPTGQNPALEGEIEIVLKPFYYLLTPNDTGRFEIKVSDRDLQMSNTVITSTFVKPD